MGGAHRHHLGNALGVDPVSRALNPDRNMRLESLGELGELDRGTGVHADGMNKTNRTCEGFTIGFRCFQHIHIQSSSGRCISRQKVPRPLP
jgi:hypothetical protein